MLKYTDRTVDSKSFNEMILTIQWKLRLKLEKGSTFRKVEKSTNSSKNAFKHDTMNKPHEKSRLHA